MDSNSPPRTDSDRRRLLAGVGSTALGPFHSLSDSPLAATPDDSHLEPSETQSDTPQSDTSQSTAHRDWPASGFDAANTSSNLQTTGPTEQIRMKWRLEEDINGAVVADGVVYAAGGGSWAGGRRQSDAVYALDADTGKERWQATFEDIWFERPTVSDKTLYVSGSENVLYALDTATGEERWRYPQNLNLDHLTVVDDIVYLGCRTQFVALDTTTGEVRWQFDTDGPVYRPTAVAGGRLFINNPKGHWADSDPPNFGAFDAETGDSLWTYEFPGDCEHAFGGPTVGDGVVYAGAGTHGFDEEWGRVVALDTRTGNEQWNHVVDEPMNQTMALAHGRLFVSVNGGVVALDVTDGTRHWEFSLDPADRNVMDNVDRYSPPAVVGETVYVGGYDTALYALDAKTGERKWAYALPGQYRASSQPAVVDGTVYVTCGFLYALAETGGGGVTASYVMKNASPGAAHDLTVGGEIQFWANLSRGPITEFAWDFTDDGSVDATGKFATYSYDTPGEKAVTLRVTGDDGRTDAMKRLFEVEPQKRDE